MKHKTHFNLTLIFLFFYATLAIAQTEEEYESVTTILDFASQANVYGIESKGYDGANPNPTVFKVNDITITLEGITLLYGTNNNSSHYLRIDYDSKENGNITFSCPSGITIDKMTFTAASNKIALTPPTGKEISCSKEKSCYWENSKKKTTSLTFSTNKSHSYIAKIEISYTRPKINVTLREKDTDISNTIKENTGETRVATERIFHNNGKNTVCLPFDITLNSLKEIFGDDTQAAIYSGSDDESISFSTVKSGTISTGMPFILIPEIYVENPNFYDIELKDDNAKEIRFGNISFCGTYSPYEMQTDGSELFMNSSQVLARPKSDGNTMRGLRAFFRLENNNEAKFSILFNGETSTIYATKNTMFSQKGNKYSIDGKKHCDNNTKGKGKIVILSGKKFLIK